MRAALTAGRSTPSGGDLHQDPRAPAWKWLHHSALFVFYLSLLHAGYFLFLHYTASFHTQVPPPDWFRFPFATLGTALVLLQATAFVKTAARPNRAPAA